MKWLPAWGMVQQSFCGRYAIQHPVESTWIAYCIPTVGTPTKLDECDSDEKAKQRCDDDEREMVALRRAG